MTNLFIGAPTSLSFPKTSHVANPVQIPLSRTLTFYLNDVQVDSVKISTPGLKLKDRKSRCLFFFFFLWLKAFRGSIPFHFTNVF